VGCLQDLGGANGHSKDLEAGPVGPSQADVNLQQFFDEVAEIKSQMAAIRRNLHKLQDANEESKQVTRAPDMKGEAPVTLVGTSGRGASQSWNLLCCGEDLARES
jgi:hypothetical protein